MPVAPVERAALLASVLLVLIVELLNSSVEAAIDRARDLARRTDATIRAELLRRRPRAIDEQEPVGGQQRQRVHEAVHVVGEPVQEQDRWAVGRAGLEVADVQ